MPGYNKFKILTLEMKNVLMRTNPDTAVTGRSRGIPANKAGQPGGEGVGIMVDATYIE